MRVFPMKRKFGAHEALFQRDDVPPWMIVDGSKKQVEGDFARKCKEDGCYLKQTEPYSHWKNAAESSIKELKRGAGRKMLKARSPKILWDYCVELESYVRSHTAHNIYCLNGETPEAIMSGETLDISQIFELEWYEWIMFRDLAVSFTEDNMIPGRYLGISIDIGTAMTVKILKSNGEVVHRSTHQYLLLEELGSTEQKLHGNPLMRQLQ